MNAKRVIEERSMGNTKQVRTGEKEYVLEKKQGLNM